MEKNQWSLRKNNVANLIRNRAPDLFGLQEALPGQIADLKAALPAYQKSHCGPESTFSTFFVGNEMGKCIDHIFVTSQDFKILQHGTLTDSNNGFYPSDHLPVLTEITFKNNIFG